MVASLSNAAASASSRRGRKPMSRETAFHKAKAKASAEAQARNRRALEQRSDGSASVPSPSAKALGKMKALPETAHPYRYKSFNDRLASAHVSSTSGLTSGRGSTLAGLDVQGVAPEQPDLDEIDLEDADEEAKMALLQATTAFGSGLAAWSDLNLSNPFQDLVRRVRSHSISLPLLIHHREKIANALSDVLTSRSASNAYLAYEPALDLFPRLALDLGSEFLPVYTTALSSILQVSLINRNVTGGDEKDAARIVEKSFESMAALFKNIAALIIPREESKKRDLLKETWDIVKPYLGWQDLSSQTDGGRTPRHVRRFGAEAFAYLLRRCKQGHLQKAANYVLDDVEAMLLSSKNDEASRKSAIAFAAGVASVWLEVVKSVEGRLHSQAATQLATLLLPADSSSASAASRRLVGRLLVTAMIHQGHSSHLEPLFELLIEAAEKELRTLTSEPSFADQELKDALYWLATAVGTRKGTRVSDPIKTRLFQLLLQLVSSPNALSSDAMAGMTVKLASLILPIGKVTDSVGNGAKILAALSKDFGQHDRSTAAFSAVVLSLADSGLHWSGFERFALPQVLSVTSGAIASDKSSASSAAYHLLVQLKQQEKLDDLLLTSGSAATAAVTRWKRVLAQDIERRVSDLPRLIAQASGGEADPEQSVIGTLPALEMLPFVSADQKLSKHVTTELCSCIDILVKGLDIAGDQAHMRNGAIFLSAIANGLSAVTERDRDCAKVAAQACTNQLISTAMSRLSRDKLALLSILKLLTSVNNACSLDNLPRPDDIAEHLWTSLMSEDEVLRQAATGWLVLACQGHLTSEQHELRELYELMSKIESIPLRVETVRDRNVRLRSLVRDLLRHVEQANSGSQEATQLDHAARTVCRYVVGTLKLNFKPLWEESRKALVDLSVRYGNELWNVTFAELVAERPQKAPEVVSATKLVPSSDVEVVEEDDVEVDEDEDKTFRDPQRSNREGVIREAWVRFQESLVDQMLQHLVREQQATGRLDVGNYQSQLLLLYTELPLIVEKHNSGFVDHFLNRIVEKDQPIIEADEEDEEEEEAVLANTTTPTSSNGRSLTLRQRQERLSGYLSVFAKFVNPKALYRSLELHSFFYSLLAQGDNKIQRLALQCVLTWKSPAQTAYQEILFNLLDQSKFRDELTGFDLSPEGTSIQVQDREVLMPLLLRLLYGLAISRKGRSSASASGSTAKKIAILSALSRCPSSELGVVMELMSHALADQRPQFNEASGAMTLSTHEPRAYQRQQNGFLSFLGDAIKHVGKPLLPYWPVLVGVTINLIHQSSIKAAEQGPGGTSASFRDTRQTAVRRLADFFRLPSTDDFEWSPFVDAIFASAISPRLPTFAAENSQSPSALLDLINVWSTRRSTMGLLAQGDLTLLPNVYQTLAEPTVKNSVITVIFDIVDRMLVVAEDSVNAEEDPAALHIRESVLKPSLSSLVASLGPLLRQTSSALHPDVPLLQREISLVARLAVFVSDPSDASAVLAMLGPVMKKSNRIVPEKSKADLLATFRDLLSLTDTFRDPRSETFATHYEMFSSMWSKLRSLSARVKLGQVFRQISTIDGSLVRLASWVEGLNALSERRIEEIDFDRRLAVFDVVTREDLNLSLREWQPLVHNALFFLQDPEELVLRSNASALLKKFFKAVHQEAIEGGELRLLFVRTVYPALKRCLRAKSDLVRREVLSVIGEGVRTLTDIDALAEMRGLLVEGDEEANFFNNIEHIQLHRRCRALRRLADFAETSVLRNKTISDVFLVLLGHTLETPGGDQNLVNDTLACLGVLVRKLDWGSYNAVLWKYLRLADKKAAGEKLSVRAAMAILDNFHFGMDDTIAVSTERDEEDGDVPTDEAEEQSDAAEAVDANRRIVTSVTTKLLPALMGYLEHHDDNTDDALRLPIAVGVIRVVECLPVNEKEIHLAKLLNVLANVFKSKSQETRDLARETLCKIASALGHDRLPQVVKELRRVLTRGPQLAVLAFTVHAVLIRLVNQPEDPLTRLDRGVEDIMDIVSEDLFGLTGEDRETIEYKTKVKEMRQSKSLDTFEQVGRIIAPHCVNALLTPLKRAMEHTQTPRTMKAVEDALRRIASGINANQQFDAAALLGLCHSLITQNATFLKTRKAAAKGAAQPKHDLATLVKRKDYETAQNKSDNYAENAFRFVAFGLDLLVTALRRTRFDFSDKDVLGRLDPLVAAVGNTLYAGDAHVLALGLRATGGLLRCPLPSLKAALPIFVRQTVSTINREANPATDVSQAALRTLTIMLRDCPDAEFKESQLADLLTLTLPDIEEPAAQGSIFGFLRSIIGRRFVIPEVYDVMDKVAEMMVTNQSAQVREVCRAAFLQFLLDYPQGKGRLRNQMEFLAKNLSYVFESGRLSVMELLSAILAKFSDDILREYGELLFVALVMSLANDDSSKCREKASDLAKALLGLISEEQQAKLVEMTHSWAENETKPQLNRVALQVYGLLLEAVPPTEEGAEWISRAVKNARSVVIDCADDLTTLEEADDDMDLDASSLDWQLPYNALQALSKFGKIDVSLLLSGKEAPSLWAAIRKLLLFPHAWVQTAACRLLGTLFATSQPSKPIRSASASQVDPLSLDALVDASRKLALQLRGEAVDEVLSLQIVKNILWIGKSFALMGTSGGSKRSNGAVTETEEEEESGAESSDDNEDAFVPKTNDDDTSSAFANPLAWLFTKLSYQSRSIQGGEATASNPSGLQTTSTMSILRWFAAMAQYLSSTEGVPSLDVFLHHIINPLFRILEDPTLPSHSLVDDLKALAIEVQDLVQEKVGANRYSVVYSEIRSRAMEKRRQRKTKRLLQGVKVAGQEGEGEGEGEEGQDSREKERKRREKRNEARHDARKRKNRAYMESRGKKRSSGGSGAAGEAANGGSGGKKVKRRKWDQ